MGQHAGNRPQSAGGGFQALVSAAATSGNVSTETHGPAFWGSGLVGSTAAVALARAGVLVAW